MPKSKFEQIYKELKQDIESGTLAYESLIPSENQLVVRFDCSRNTVRRAIAMLAEEGYVQPMHGRGVRIIYQPSSQDNFTIGGVESFGESAARNHRETSTRVVRFAEITADERISARTGFKVGTELYYIQRVRSLDGAAVVFDINLFDRELVPGLTEEICTESIYRYIEETLGMPIVMSKRTITVERATPVDIVNLDLDDYDCLAVVNSQTFNSEGVQFEFNQSRRRPDFFCFQTTATRRRKPSDAGAADDELLSD